jgi:folate-binding protein YgfZ
MSTSPLDQARAARKTVLAVPEPDLLGMEVTGKDRLSWLNGLLTCELASAQPQDAVYGLAVAQKGRILSDLFVLVAEDRAIVLVRRAAAASLAETFESHLMMEEAELTRAFEDFSVLMLHGPSSRAILDSARRTGSFGGLVDMTGLGGAVLAFRKSAERGVRDAVTETLARDAGVMGDLAGWEALRLERGVPRFGVDFDGTTYPQEAGLEQNAVSFSKGCYLGQEVVCMLQMRGHVKRRLAALVLDGPAVPAKGAHVLDGAAGGEGMEVGQITSAALSPTLDTPVALAMVKHAFAHSGRVFTVDGQVARVVERPA